LPGRVAWQGACTRAWPALRAGRRQPLQRALRQLQLLPRLLQLQLAQLNQLLALLHLLRRALRRRRHLRLLQVCGGGGRRAASVDGAAGRWQCGVQLEAAPAPAQQPGSQEASTRTQRGLLLAAGLWRDGERHA
jgi:hypothetical protein